MLKLNPRSCLVPSRVLFAMSKLLQALIQEVAGSPTERDLRLHFMDKAGALFCSQHWAISLHKNQEGLDTIDLKGLPDSFVDYY